MSGCTACGGLIAEPGRVYGYAGKFCHCVTPSPSPSAFLPMPPATPLSEMFKVLPPKPELAVEWLCGYLEAKAETGLTPQDVAALLKRLRARP